MKTPRLGHIQLIVLSACAEVGEDWAGVPVDISLESMKWHAEVPELWDDRNSYKVLQRLRELGLVEPVYAEKFPALEDYYVATEKGRKVLAGR